MEVIVSHMNLNFDGLASLVAAKKLYPRAIVVLTEQQQTNVKSFIASYRDQLTFSSYDSIQWSNVRSLVLVDVASLNQTGIPEEKVPNDIALTIYDHHPNDEIIQIGTKMIKKRGATISILVEYLIEQAFSISPFEATLFGLALYTKTRRFTSTQTTSEDFIIATFLIKSGMDLNLLNQFSKPIVTALEMMSSPVKTVLENETIETVLEQMFQYGHNGFPVIDQNSLLVGVISRRDVDRAIHHHLGQAPVSAYMSSPPITLSDSSTIDMIQSTMLKHGIGRIPIMANEQLTGIVSRTDVIEQWQERGMYDGISIEENSQSLATKLQIQLPDRIFRLLLQIGEIADQEKINLYLIGGIVRDVLLNRSNEDIDLVIEGNGISFAEAIASQLGGSVKSHNEFGTATWTSLNGEKIDIVTCRTEYYESPAKLPTIRPSNIREDISRRDFTINALAIKLNKGSFGLLLDYYQGQLDLKKRKIRVLHSLSFVEDPTRIFRAVRFSLRFDFQFTKHTFQLAVDAAKFVKKLSPKRILRELQLLSSEGFLISGFALLDQFQIWEALFNKTISSEAMNRFKRLQANDITDPFLYLIAFIYSSDFRNEHVSDYALTATDQQLLTEIEKLQVIKLEERTGMIHRQLQAFSKESLMFYALITNNVKIASYVQKRTKEIPFLTGQDLIQERYSPGPVFKDILLDAFCLQLDHHLTTKAEAITWLRSLR
ncbi:CBS domain-containing protein [Bacillus suaedae]|uniref:CBS domain-containing protein n=1 Tax=Halalkalibacter suaedae TaxID=2822140 RepID=A0A940WXC6_9BACI|nr:CBS domain-containing protein [Bacillus suaedae]MBP3949554.1 CBS domain-containing protein [Bacillus suaedae]